MAITTSNEKRIIHMRCIMKLFFIIAICQAVTTTTTADPVKKLVIAKDTVITADLIIPEGTICEIKPGVHVTVDGYFTVTVRGLLIAVGTKVAPIVFSPISQEGRLPSDPVWKGVEVIGKSAQAQFKYCKFKAAYRHLVWEAGPTYDSCEFSGNHYGLYCAKKAFPKINSCRFFKNTYGIVLDLASPIMQGNSITENVIGLNLQLASETFSGNNFILNNTTNVHSETAYGGDTARAKLQNLWKVMQQLY